MQWVLSFFMFKFSFYIGWRWFALVDAECDEGFSFSATNWNSWLFAAAIASFQSIFHFKFSEKEENYCENYGK